MEPNSIPGKNEMVVLHIVRSIVVESDDGLQVSFDNLSILLGERSSLFKLLLRRNLSRSLLCACLAHINYVSL